MSTILLALASLTACQSPASAPTGTPAPIQGSPDAIRDTPTTSVVLDKATATVQAVSAEPASIPPVWDFISDDFESGSLDRWGEISPANLSLGRGEGYAGSIGLSVTVHKRESYLYKTDIVKSKEGYATFWFNPNAVDLPDQADVPVPGKSVRIVDIKGYEHYDVIAALRIWKPADFSQGYRGYLEWQAGDGSHFDLDSGQFDLANGWQKITLGYRTNEWVAVWIDGALVRRVTGVQHSEAFGQNVEFGKANDDSVTIPAGSMRYDDVSFGIPRIADLWVDAGHGNDANTGRQPDAAFRTIQAAAGVAGPGTQVHILPGIYRESISPTADGTPAEPVVYKAEQGRGTVIIRGSEPSNTLDWHPLQSNTIGLPAGVDPARVYYADLSAWRLDQTPRFVVQLDGQGNVLARLPLAREPDWPVTTDWKYQEFWWSADGGSVKANCNPATDTQKDCDLASRSLTMLTDTTDDTSPSGIEPGNLSVLDDLTGATVVAIDAQEGHYVYRRTIVSHDRAAGRITVDRNCEFDDDPGNPGLGWGTRYFVEGKPSLLDSPGEWWYDASTGLLYIWPSSSASPSDLNIEISRQETGFDLSHRSNVTIDGLTLEFFNGSAIHAYNESNTRSENNTVQNVLLQYADDGVNLVQAVGDNPEDITSHFTLQRSEIAHIDTNGIHLAYTWKDESAPASFAFAGITGTAILGNDLHDLGFRSDQDNANGVSFEHADGLRFEGNHVYDVAHNGVQFSWSVIQANRSYGFAPGEIKTGEILVKDNVFEQACQLTSDCAGLKFWGDPPAEHVYRDVLITGNIFRNTFGWSSISELRGRWTGGPGSQVRGMGGFGLYLDMASGIHIYRNIAYNNAFAGVALSGVWRDGDMVLYNNTVGNSLYGLYVSGLEFDTHGNVDTQIANNILMNNEAGGMWFTDTRQFADSLVVDFNLYYNNGWRPQQEGGIAQPGAFILRRAPDTFETYQTLSLLQSGTPWEAHGRTGDPGFLQYRVDDHDLHDGSWPDFQLGPASVNVVDCGTERLPESLTDLLRKFGVQDQRVGGAYDIGRYERGSSNASLGAPSLTLLAWAARATEDIP